MKISVAAGVAGSFVVLVAGAGATQATTPTPVSRTVAIADASFPKDTTWSLDNTFTSATSPTQKPAGSYLDLAKVTLTYSPATRLLEVDWVTTTDLTNYNCPAVQAWSGNRCSFWAVVYSAPGGATPALTADYNIEFTGNPWRGAQAQGARMYSGGDWQGDLKVIRTETFGRHQAIWVAIPSGPASEQRPGVLQNDGTFTSVGAGGVDDPFFIDAKHDIAILRDSTDARPDGAPDLSLG